MPRSNEENIYAEMLLNSVFPGLTINLKKSESPDFLFTHKNRIIGIEVTELSVPTEGRPHRELEGMEDFITRRAKRLALDRGLPPISVWLFFNLSGAPPRKRWEIIAESVVDTVQHNLPAVGKRIELTYSLTKKHQPREVDLIHISRNEHAYRHIWHPVRASWVMKKTQDLFQKCIDQKNNKYEKYREKCDECWLIMGAEGTRQSSAIRPDEPTLESSYSSKFERVFFIRRVDTICKELKLLPQ